jgi:enterochelin esterase family protein
VGSSSARGGAAPVVTMTKGENGVWSGTTVRAMRPGAWRYTFTIEGATVVDSRNVRVSTSQTQVQSLLVVPGDFSETRDVPHGTVGLARYVARTLGNARREMYVYTPPGYEKGTGRYPVLYLIHGGGDTAVSWSTVGRANDILDNLIAEKKSVPMIVAMPSGWTPSGGQVMTSDATKDPFNDELLKDIIPFVEANYRTTGTADARALSGLSMGGIQTLNIGLHNLGTFRYLAVMSSGWISEQDREFFYKAEAAKIPKYNSALKLFWWGWGETDIARANGLAVIDTFKSRGVKIETRESPGGHTWDNWRLYLYEVAPKLFR